MCRRLVWQANDGKSGFTRIFTYVFGAGAANLMSSIACENGGIYHKISDSQAPQLKEIISNYFVRPFWAVLL